MSGMRTRWFAAAVALAVAVVAAAVGYLVLRDDDEDPQAAYCEAVEAERADLSEALAGGESTGLIAALPHFEALAAEAPRDLEDEWEIVVEVVTDLRDALDEAGVDPASYDPKKPPADLDPDDRDAIAAAADALASRRTTEAFAGVQQHSRDVCRTPLTL